MKKYKNIVLLASAVIALSGCQGDLLDLNPYSAVSSGSMWTTENLADQGVTGVYSVLRKTNVGLGLFNFDCYGVSSDCRDPDYALLRGNATASSSIFSDYWKEHYEGIHRANDAITNLPKAPMDDAKRKRLIAESKFLRAFFYYKLNMLFKGVPLYLEPVELKDCIKGRETEAKIWETVLTDLADCINESNLPDRYPAGNVNVGRITKAAAYALRGKVYLWTKEWAKAEADFKKVGELGHKLYTGEGGYKALFKEANEQSEEMVLSVQCIGLSGYGNEMSFRYGTRSTFGSCWNTYLVNTDFVESYEWADGKPFNWNDVIPGYNEMDKKARAVYFLRDNMTPEQKKAMAENQKADMSKYMDVGNEARIKKAYENRDPRMTASIITPYSEYLGADGATAYKYILRWPYSTNLTPWFDLKTDSNNRYYYLFRKFVAEGASEIPNRSYSPIDFPLIRYADVLLGLAEALNEQGGAKVEEAVTYVNQVRNRAGVAPLNSNVYTKVNGQNEMRVRIQKERRWEFNGEGVNFFDEIRWNTWKETKFFPGAGLKQIWGEQQYENSWGGDYYYTWAIPNTEINMNGNLTQNSGWIN